MTTQWLTHLSKRKKKILEKVELHKKLLNFQVCETAQNMEINTNITRDLSLNQTRQKNKIASERCAPGWNSLATRHKGGVTASVIGCREAGRGLLWWLGATDRGPIRGRSNWSFWGNTGFLDKTCSCWRDLWLAWVNQQGTRAKVNHPALSKLRHRLLQKDVRTKAVQKELKHFLLRQKYIPNHVQKAASAQWKMSEINSEGAAPKHCCAAEWNCTELPKGWKLISTYYSGSDRCLYVNYTCSC